MTTRFSKLYSMLKGYASGKGFDRLLVAIEEGRRMHSGFRKDGVTPEFQHQLEIAHYLITVSGSIDNLEDTLIVAILHDSDEDEAIKFNNPRLIGIIGPECTDSIYTLNKHRVGSLAEYHKALALDPCASLAKGADRINNMGSMHTANYTLEKQMSQAEEVRDLFLPMLKEARKNFPRQMSAYYNIETVLKIQMNAVFTMKKMIDASVKPTDISL